MRTSVIDMGTNTFKLTMAELDGDGFRVIGVEQRGVRLGSCSYQYGLIPLPAMERAVNAIEEFTRISRQHGAIVSGAFATAIFRDAQNSRQLLEIIEEKTNVFPAVISAQKEAELIQNGVWHAMKGRVPPNMLIMDMGGGSLEFIRATDKKRTWLRSFPLGAFPILRDSRLSDPVTPQDMERVNQKLTQELKPLFREATKEQQVLVGCSGAFETFAQMMGHHHDNANECPPPSVQLHREPLEKLFQKILNANSEQRKQMKGLPLFRVDTIVPAVMVTQYIISKINPEKIYASFYSMAEGAIGQMIHQKK